MININLVDYRRIAEEVAIQKRFVNAIGVIVLVVVACGVHMLFVKNKIDGLTARHVQLSGQVDTLTGEFKVVQAMKNRGKRLNEIISGIDKLRSGDIDTSRLLEDLAGSLPESVWLEHIEQMDLKKVKSRVPVNFIKAEDPKKKKKKKKGKKEPEGVAHKFVEIKGHAFKDQAVIRFIHQLETLPYFDHVVLSFTKMKEIGAKEAKVEVREFAIYCHFAAEEKPKT